MALVEGAVAEHGLKIEDVMSAQVSASEVRPSQQLYSE